MGTDQPSQPIRPCNLDFSNFPAGGVYLGEKIWIVR
jgi:hypothetical protein